MRLRKQKVHGLTCHRVTALLCSPCEQACKILQVIAEHFFHEGNFTVGDCFLQEACVADGAAIREPYVAMHAILEQVTRTSASCNSDAWPPPEMLHCLLSTLIGTPAELPESHRQHWVGLPNRLA